MIYAVSMQDGSVAIMQTIGDTQPADVIAKWAPAARDAVVSVQEIDASTIPTDRTFRDAWKLDGTSIAHDMGKAAAIHVSRMRRAREPLFTALDAAWMKAVGTGDKDAAAEIDAKRQALRDVPQNAEAALKAAKTIEDIKATWPQMLPMPRR